MLFIKAPVPGRVKTRLAAVLGNETTLELYRSFCLDMLETIDASCREVVVFHDPPDAREMVVRWLGKERRCHPQQGADLGERMENAFRSAFSSNASRAILIGSDLPDLPSAVLAEALDALERNDAVIGPALDGGYYLIGLRKAPFRPEVFRGIPWSTSVVFDQTMRILARSGYRVHLLPRWQDVDRIDDLLELYERSRGTAFERSRTMPILRDICGRIQKDKL